MLRLEEEIRLLSAQLDQRSPEGLKQQNGTMHRNSRKNLCNNGSTRQMWQGIRVQDQGGDGEL